MSVQNPAPQVASRIVLREAKDIVICFLPHNNITPFVVWRRDREYFYGGIYCENLLDACHEFERRTGGVVA